MTRRARSLAALALFLSLLFSGCASGQRTSARTALDELRAARVFICNSWEGLENAARELLEIDAIEEADTEPPVNPPGSPDTSGGDDGAE